MKKKLRVSSEVVRVLASTELEFAIGGVETACSSGRAKDSCPADPPPRIVSWPVKA